jgi:hypothetical protein
MSEKLLTNRRRDREMDESSSASDMTLSCQLAAGAFGLTDAASATAE